MKRIALLLLPLLPSLGLSQPAQAAGLWLTNEVGLLHIDSMTYSVPWTRLPIEATWAPERQPFPLNLQQVTKSALLHIRSTRNDTNTMKLGGLVITRHVHAPTKWAEYGISPGDIQRQWFVFFDFYHVYVASGHPRPMAVMFLDETFAQERPANTVTIITDTAPEDALFFYAGETSHAPDPYAATRTKDFTIPVVRWDPEQQAFPMNLDSEITRAESRLLADPGAHGPLFLDRIQIWPFVPLEALTAKGLGPEAHGHHWTVSFRFDDGQEHFKEVIMLLDGRILGTAASPPGKTLSGSRKPLWSQARARCRTLIISRGRCRTERGQSWVSPNFLHSEAAPIPSLPGFDALITAAATKLNEWEAAQEAARVESAERNPAFEGVRAGFTRLAEDIMQGCPLRRRYVLKCRRSGGLKTLPLPDFCIGDHAEVESHPLVRRAKPVSERSFFTNRSFPVERL